ncbi:M56 family metallopeptidase [Bacteroides sp. 51]|uniref:M56 family metallopeptidase n=1 Tax=Bacteroides sp. 51 TaxID=2302938 RepID=UPI0013D56362|nr:M56 family metallopeptidase [Bacteroides sp. 51]NDV83104.1 TonB family protein [Bacteroides sp. 51]
MNPELAYFLKVNVAIALFYAFYRLFFYKDTFFKWRRTALLCFFGISILYPLLNIQEWIKEQEPIVAMADIYSTVILPEINIDFSDEASQADWKYLIISSLKYIYWGIAGLFIIRFLVQLLGIIRIGFRTPTTILQNTKVHLLDKHQGPFSFFKWIFVHPDSHTEQELEEILTHEQTHASQWHSIDVLLSELLCILCWFNPFVWLMKREIRNNLEFMADHKVLETGHDCKTYQYHLLGLAHQKSVATLYNSFNVLPLKIRIRMMNKKRTKQIGRTKYLIFLPLAALLLIVSNIEAIARSTEKLIDHVIQPENSSAIIETQESNIPVQEPLTASTQQDNYIAATRTASEPPAPPAAIQQEKKYLYKGTVINTNNKPLKGVQIVMANTTTPLTVTNEKGEFSFEWKDQATFSLLYRTSENVVMAQTVTSDSKKEDRQNMVIVMAQVPAFIPEEVKGPGEDVIFEIVEQMPEFPGGNKALMEFLSANIKYPKAAQDSKTQGRVIIQFVVSETGDIKNPTIIRNVSPEIDEEAMRVITLMPKWKPGMQRGKAVNVKYTIPIMFNLGQSANSPQFTPSKITDYEESKINGETVYGLADNMPEFPGGARALMDYITKEMQYPANAKEKSIQGRVIVQFVVDKEGDIKYPRIVRNVDPSLDQEALRIINNMPKWKPGKIKGEDVSTKYTVPIMFRIE